MKKRYGVLRALSTILKILGVVAAVIAVLVGIAALMVSFSNTDLFTSMGLDANLGALIGLLCGALALISGLLCAAMLYGYGEMIMLTIAIEENTARTATLLEDVTKEEVK